MVELVFFEKPGCSNNTQQKRWLAERGIKVEAIDLLSYPWSESELLAFFEKMPVSDWFNRSAPRVKAGEVVPEKLTREEALQLLMDEHLLIRRPLLRKGDERFVGFDGPAISKWLVIVESAGETLPVESCPRPERPCQVEEQ